MFLRKAYNGLTEPKLISIFISKIGKKSQFLTPIPI